MLKRRNRWFTPRVEVCPGGQSSGSLEKALLRMETQLMITTDTQPINPTKNIHCKTLLPQYITWKLIN